MALYLLQSGVQPLGQFDVLNTEAADIVGGELMTLDKYATGNTAAETAAADVGADGYIVVGGTITAYRTVAKKASTGTGPVFLADDGKAGYGVLFGSIVGASTGLAAGTNLGPSTLTGSGKVTLWDKPGLYGVSLDALASGVIESISGNITRTPTPGTALYCSSGKLALSGTGQAVAYFVEMSNSGGLVQTPTRLFNGSTTTAWDRIVIQFLGSRAA